MTPFIQNCSMSDVAKGLHQNPGFNSMLIQISDPASEPPKPAHQFRETYQFEFLDIEEHDKFGEEFKITKDQAAEIVRLLNRALSEEMNVIVHCHMGVCRSGAVCEVGTMMGFRDTEVYRQPNIMVKTYLMRELGWTYD